MAVNDSVSRILEELVDNICNATNTDTSSTALIEEIFNNHVDDDQYEQDNNEDGRVVQNVEQIVNTQTSVYYPANEPILLKINQINSKIDFVWKIQGVIIYKHPKRIYTNANGAGEVSIWDLVDDTGSINLVAFNLNSNLMSTKLTEGKSYEFNQLSIRRIDEVYKTLPYEFQLVVTNSTNVQEIVLNLLFNYEQTFNFTNLQEIETLPLNSIIDVDVLVLRDYGINIGTTNNSSWSRRELHVAQDGVHIQLILWNDKAKIVKRSMVNKHLKLKNVKVSWFNGSRVLATLGNTRVSVV